jgi:hypothetical protein
LAALHLFPTATSIPLFPLPAPAAKANLRSQARLHPLPSRSRVRLSPPRRRLLGQRRPRDWRIVKTTAATRTGMALRHGARSESTTRDRAATRQATTSGARTARALCEISGRAGVGAFLRAGRVAKDSLTSEAPHFPPPSAIMLTIRASRIGMRVLCRRIRNAF